MHRPGASSMTGTVAAGDRRLEVECPLKRHMQLPVATYRHLTDPPENMRMQARWFTPPLSS